MYAYLRAMEDEFPIRSEYLAGYPVTSKMRSVLVDWLVEVQQQFNLLPETLYLTVSIIDRYRSNKGGWHRLYPPFYLLIHLIIKVDT